MKLTRRNFGVAGLAAASSAVAAPAIAQSAPTVNWRMVSSFPKSLDNFFNACMTISRLVSEMSDKKFNIQVFAAGEIVPGLQVLDAVQNGTVESGHTYSGYYIGKDTSLIFDGSLPFGMTPRQHQAWLQFGGGQKLVDEVYDRHGVIAIPAGNTGAQMFGWFRKELKTVQDFQGLKMRVAGFGGRVLGKLGVVPQQIAAGDIYAALERGTLDAVEFVNAYDDEKLGFFKVAKYYYGPCVMELEASIPLIIGKNAWASIPPAYQAMLRTAAIYADVEMQAANAAKNATAIKSVIAKGAQISWLTPEIVKALYTASEQVLDEEAGKNPNFAKVMTSWREFRAEQHRYFQIADANAEMTVYAQRT